MKGRALLSLVMMTAAACTPAPTPTASPTSSPSPTATGGDYSGEPSPMRQDGALATAEQKAAAEALYLAPKYDIKRDPVADVKAASAKAVAEKKRILIEVGGHWCVWCHLLDNYLAVNADVRDAFGQSFIIVKVNFSDENPNAAFLGQYPKIGGYPHFFVLEADGSFLASQDTGELEQGRGYDHAKMMAFATKWRP